MTTRLERADMNLLRLNLLLLLTISFLPFPTRLADRPAPARRMATSVRP